MKYGWSTTFFILDYSWHTIYVFTIHTIIQLWFLFCSEYRRKVLFDFVYLDICSVSWLSVDSVWPGARPRLNWVSTVTRMLSKTRRPDCDCSTLWRPHTWPGWCLLFLRSKLRTWCQLYFQETSQFSVPSLQTNLLKKLFRRSSWFFGSSSSRPHYSMHITIFIRTCW